MKKIALSEKEELRIEVRQLKGHAFADFRVYAHSRAEEAKWPTGKGFLIPAARLQELQRALAELNLSQNAGAES